uniref:Homeobox domain-containing protein n=1 Tax=Heterorhabditis bacteriophora TaxID=37862 RepID=A0A1I7XKG0_HETBA
MNAYKNICFRSSVMTVECGYVKVLKIKGADGEERTLQFPMKLDLERPKRPRTTFSSEQLKILEEAFTKNGYLTGEGRTTLAEKLGLSDTQVKVWFQNRRTKNRRKAIESDTVRSSQPSSQQQPSTDSTSSSTLSALQFSTIMYPTHPFLSYPTFYPTFSSILNPRISY